MKKGLYILLFIFTASVSAQSSFGVKAGLNYGDNGEIEFSDFENAGKDVSKGADSKVGYHMGVYFKGDLGSFYLKPELLYTKTKSSYEYNNENADYNVSKLDLPVLLGVKILGPVHVFAGPSFQYILENDFDGVTIGDVENEFTLGAQFGAGLQLGRFGLDVRYERGLTENEAQVLDLNNPNGLKRVDSRPNQIIFAVSLDL
ncbi:outer membrane beta-barrel protein [Salinimicrobium gaetbulicola]|uniref:Outer membrane beta-barrel protein n=1 Tax=Salinimicrobium gaetbulicola TaxID=999702 RepID=A0ABW3IIS4_9FLAO